MLNSINLVGRLTADPEQRKTQNNDIVVEFDIANNGLKQANGKEDTLFIRVVVYGKGATACQMFLSKGSLVSVTGRLHAFSYVNKKTNAEIKGVEIIANNVDFIDTGKRADKTAEGAKPQEAAKEAADSKAAK
jgi:single-strand DNA-binding protein